MSSGKGGSSQKYNDYYGTVAGAVCWGPLDWLNAVIHNGGYLFQGSLSITSDVTDLTGSLVDPLLIGSGGYLKLYRGTATQSADAALAGHPPYKDTVILVAKNLYFGRETATAPNLQVIGGRLPRVDTSIVASADNVADDGQVNPIAALAEFIMDERGGGVPIASMDAAAWLAAAHTAYLNKDVCFCSPLLTQQGSLADVVKQLIGPFNGFVRWSPTGLLTVKIYDWGSDPGGLTTLDAQHWTKKPRFKQGDFIDIPTELLGTYTDRDYEFQGNSVLVPNARAAQIRQVDDQRRVDLPHVTRAAQVGRLLSEMNRRFGTAPSSIDIRVRQPFVTGLLVGDKIKVDIDPEPGGTGLAQLCRIERIEQDRSDEAKLSVITDNLLPATIYHPVYPALAAPTYTCPPMQYFLAVPLPIDSFGFPESVAIVATRPSAAVAGMHLYFSDAHAHAFDYIGDQVGFAVRAQLASNITNSATTIRLTELDGLTGNDAQLAANTPGGNATAAQNNTLLILLAILDGNGRVQLDANGDPQMEFISVVDRAYVSGANFDYTVLRGRLSTSAVAWTSGAVAWIIPETNLFDWRTDLLETLAGSVSYFRLVAFTQDAIDTTATVPECSCNMPPLKAPAVPTGLTAISGTGKSVSLAWTANSESFFSEYRVYRNTVNNSSTATLVAETGSNRFVDVDVVPATTYYYWISAVSTYEVESSKSSGVNITPSATLGPFTMVTTNATDLGGGTVKKTGGAANTWDTQGYSVEGYTGGAFCSWQPANTLDYVMCGLNTDPTTNASYSSIDYAWFAYNAGAEIYEGGTGPVFGPVAYNSDTVFSVTYDGLNIRYYMDGVLKRTVVATAGLKLYMDSSIYTSNAQIRNIKFGPMGQGSGTVSAVPPSDPSAASKTSDGTYLTGDGTVLSYIALSVPALPSGAFYQNVLYKKNGGGGTWMVAAQLTNTGTATLRLDDLSPGVAYDVATVAYTQFDVPSNVVGATSSPFTAPNKTTSPNLPSGVTPHTPSSSYPVRLAMDGLYRLYSCLVTFTDSTDKDIAGYEFGLSGTPATPPGGAGFVKVPVSTQQFQFNTSSLGAQYLWYRAYDATGNITAWADSGYNLNAYVVIPSGDMVEQSSNNVNVSALKNGAAGASSIRQVVARFDVTAVATLTGGALTEEFAVSLTNRGFTTKPDTGSIGVSSDPNIKADYNYDNVSNSSTVAYVRVTTLDGTNIPASYPVRFNCTFTQYT